MTPQWRDHAEQDGSSGVQWCVYPAGVSEDRIRDDFDEFDGYYAGPGRAFCNKVYVQRTSTRTLATQFCGIDC
tara:strand:- start:360 stop:578 length:219 start_codon:yes stop_codon:yes gene_type:complete